MQEQESLAENKLNRKELLNYSLLTGLAVAAGVLGINSVNAQSSPPPAINLNVAELKKSSRKKTSITKPDVFGGKSEDYLDVKKNLADIRDKIYEISRDDSKFRLIIKDDLGRIEKRKVSGTGGTVANIFFPNNVEVLLDQASNLLDRGLQDRSEWDGLSISLFNLGIELGQFLEYDKIHLKETAAGFYDQLINDKSTTFNVDKLTKDKVSYLYDLFSKMFSERWTDDEMKAITDIQGRIALLENAGGRGTDIQPLATNLEQYRLAIEYVYNVLQKEGLATMSDQLKLKVDNDASKLSWETANRGFRFERTEVERKFEYLKLQSLMAEDGILNYTKRLGPLKERFQNDFSEAVDRLNSAEKGMRLIYGYKVALPTDSAATDYFDKCILWVRQAINYVIKFSRLDQSYVLPISIKGFYSTSEKFKKAVDDGVLEFSLTDSDFPDISYLRIKGISMFFHISDLNKHSCEHVNYYNGALQAIITPPKTSYYWHNKDKVDSVDQSYVPNLRLNRLATRGFVRVPEVGGTSLYANLSPFGNWRVELPQIKRDKINNLFKINDITIDLYLTTNRSTT